MHVMLALALASLCACELGKQAEDIIVESHRHDARGRVGVLRALQTRDAAVRIANETRDLGNRECRRLPPGPINAKLIVDAQVVSPGSDDPDSTTSVPLATFRETRTVTRDGSGSVEVHTTVAFADPSGRRGSTTRHEICTERWHYVKEGALPFVRHTAHLGDKGHVLARSLDAVPALLAMGKKGWLTQPDGSFVADNTTGGRAIACGLDLEDDGWVSRLASVAELSYAEARLASGDTSAISVRLLTGEATARKVVRLDVEESVSAVAVDPISEPTDVIDTARDRPYRDIETILGDRMGLPKWSRGPAVPEPGDTGPTVEAEVQ